MSTQGRRQVSMSAYDREVLLDSLLRRGFTLEEAQLALLDAGVPPGPAVWFPATPSPGSEHVGAPPYAPPYAPSPSGPSRYGPSPHVPAGAPEAGRRSYLLGLLAWLPIPFVAVLVAGIAMAAAYPGQRRRSPLAAENARRAANWGLTLVAGTVLSIAATVVTVLLTQDSQGGDPETTPWPLMLLIPVLVLGAMHLVITVMGLSRTARGELFRPPAVPFLRAGAQDAEIARLVGAAATHATRAGETALPASQPVS